MSETANATKEPLVMFTIYDRPKDCPNHFVARRWFCFPDEDFPRADAMIFAKNQDLISLRQMLPPGLVRLSPQEGDDPVILETWL